MGSGKREAGSGRKEQHWAGSCGPRVSAAIRKPQTTSYKPQAASRPLPFPTPRTRPPPAAGIRGPRRKRSRRSAGGPGAAGGGVGLTGEANLVRPDAEHRSGRSCKPQAAGREPYAASRRPPFRPSSRARLWLARTGTHTGALCVARGGRIEQRRRYGVLTTTSDMVLDPAFIGLTREDVRGDGGGVKDGFEACG